MEARCNRSSVPYAAGRGVGRGADGADDKAATARGRAEVALEGDGGGCQRRRERRSRRGRGGQRCTPSLSVVDQIDRVQTHPLALVQDGHGGIQQVALDGHVAMSVPQRHLVVHAVDLDDVVGRHMPALGQNEAAA